MKEQIYDFISSCGVFTGCLPLDFKMILQELIRVLKPGGYFVINYRENDRSKKYLDYMYELEKNGKWTIEDKFEC